MAARTVVCPECSETLPYGRLSCPACGALLAAVAGASPRMMAPPPPAAVPAPEPAAPAEDASATRPRRRWRAKQTESPATDQPTAAVPAAASATARPAPAKSASPSAVAPGRRSALAPSKVGAVTLAARLDATTPASGAPVTAFLGDLAASAAHAIGVPSPWRRDGVQRASEEVWADEPGGSRVDGIPAPGPNGNGAHGKAAPLPTWAGGPGGSTATGDWPAAAAPFASDGARAATPQPAKPATPPPGAWLPPSGTFTARDSGLARGKLVHPGSTRVAVPATAPNVAVAAAPVPVAAAAKPRPGEASLLADLPFESPNSLPAWLIAAGSAAAIAGFLLPWSRAIPFATGFTYLDTWGLATPSHLLVLLLTVVSLALAILPNRVPTWLRTGVAGLVVGGLLLGLVWPYLLDGFGAMIGALVDAAAALLLVIGGLLAVRPQRHAEDEPPV